MAVTVIDLGDDDGFIEFTYQGKSATFDLYRVHDQLIGICDRYRGKPEASEAFHNEVLDVLEKAGLPRGSFRVASRFMETVFDELAKLRKTIADSAAAAAKGTPDGGAPIL